MWPTFNANMLTKQQVIDRAIELVLTPERDNASYIKANFGTLVAELEDTAYQVYLQAQQDAFEITFEDFCQRNLPDNLSKEEIVHFLGTQFPTFDSFWLSLTQSRRARAGSTFEIILTLLFRRLDYPFVEQEIINGQPDFLLPSREHYDRNAMDCIIFTAKRTLRERWRQIVTEGTRGLGFFLATIDEKISANQIEEMRRHRIYVVCSQEIIDHIPVYHREPNVINYESFFRNHLDPAMRRWLEQGVVESLGDADLV
jgi:hypothetical protein